MAFSVDDVSYLRSVAGVAAAARVSELDFSRKSYLRSTAIARAEYPEHYAQLVDLVLARHKAERKLRDAAGWLLTAEAVEQATPWQVAQRRAERIATAMPGAVVHDLTCSIGAELAELVRAGITALGSDLDPARAMMAQHNAAQAYVLRADALAPVSRGTVAIADPARRDSSGRIHDPERLQPPLPRLLAILADRPYAIKCAPGLDFATLPHDGEVEVTSVDGAVREACLWSQEFAAGVRRRAVVIRSPRGDEPQWAEVITDADPEPEGGQGGADGSWDAFIVEPDSAIVRAGLVRQWAARHGLRQLDPRIAHVTGPEIPAGYSGFKVIEQQKLDIKSLRRRMRELDAGSVEILVRGVDQDPDTLRAKLGLKGQRALALVVSRIGTSAVVFVCERRRHQARFG